MYFGSTYNGDKQHGWATKQRSYLEPVVRKAETPYECLQRELYGYKQLVKYKCDYGWNRGYL
ncbi:MAG: hypothetical protein ACYTCN_08435 [Planctomycetota bacterium]|jgi:hypothetical protein